MTRWGGGPLVAAVFALWVAAPSSAVRLSPSQIVPPRGTLTTQPSVAVSGDGRTLVAWATGRPFDWGHRKIEARLGRVGRTWGRTQILSRDGEHPIAAMGMDGGAAVAWSQIQDQESGHARRALYVSIAPRGRAFGRARLVAKVPLDSEPEGIEVQPGGRVVVLWSRERSPPPEVISIQPSYVYFALLSPRSSRVHVGMVAARGGQGPGGLSATETRAGVVVVAFPATTWLAEGVFTAIRRAAVASLPVDGVTFSSPQVIEGYSHHLGRPELSSGPGGTALAAGNSVFALRHNGVFGAPIDVRESPREVAEVEAVTREPFEYPIGCCELSVALPSDGATVAVGARRRYGVLQWIDSSLAIAMLRPAGAGAFGYPVPLTQAAGRSANPRVVAGGAATLALWVHAEAPSTRRVYAALRPGGGLFSTAVPVSTSYEAEQEECELRGCEIAVAGSGRYAIAGWVLHYVLHVMTLTG